MKCLEKCTGIGEIQFVEALLVDIPREERLAYVEHEARKFREYYCQNVCPVSKFRRKYQKWKDSGDIRNTD